MRTWFVAALCWALCGSGVAFAADTGTGEPCPSGLDDVGECTDGGVQWCEDDELNFIKCGLFEICTFDAEYGYYDCAEDKSGSGTCVGHCNEETPGGCWCDKMCYSYGDCCADNCTACGYCGQADPPVGEDAGSTGGDDAGSGSSVDAGSTEPDGGGATSPDKDAGSTAKDAASSSDSAGSTSGTGAGAGNGVGTGTNGQGSSPYGTYGGSNKSGCNASRGAPLSEIALLFAMLALAGLARRRPQT